MDTPRRSRAPTRARCPTTTTRSSVLITTSATPLQGSTSLWRGLRELLSRTYDTSTLERATGIRPLSVVSMDRLAECSVRLGDAPCRTPAVELFLLGSSVDAAEAATHLMPCGLEALSDAGLLERNGDAVRALVSIVPFEHLWLVGDRINEQGILPGGRVPNTDLSTRLISSVVSRDPAGSMLDLGTGTGVLSLLGAQHCSSVTGVDINPRALAFARFNAGLNEVSSAEWVEGSFFEPLGGRAFDVVVANPPFIISPDRDDLHRFGGGTGDALSRDVIAGSAAHLDEGGTAYILCDVGVGPGQEWSDQLRGWVAGLGCDALLLRLGSMSAADYALANHDPHAYRTSRKYAEASSTWRASYQSLGIAEIASAIVVLRRRTGADCWTRAFTLAGDLTRFARDRVAGLVAAQDDFRLEDPGQLLEMALVLVDGHELAQGLHRVDGSYVPAPLRLYFADLPLVGTIAPEGLPVLLALEPGRDLATVLDCVADEYGFDAAELRTSLLPQLQELAQRGFLRRTPRREPTEPELAGQ